MTLFPVLRVALAASLLVACRAEPASNVSQALPPEPVVTRAPSGLELAPLVIQEGGRAHHFTVEVARTGQEQARGMMFRESVGPNEGMIFPFVPARPASFWMRNTLIPLDIIFIRRDGSIARIAANAVPHQETPTYSVEEPVAAVLEIRGGRAAELGITANARVTWQDRFAN